MTAATTALVALALGARYRLLSMARDVQNCLLIMYFGLPCFIRCIL